MEKIKKRGDNIMDILRRLYLTSYVYLDDNMAIDSSYYGGDNGLCKSG